MIRTVFIRSHLEYKERVCRYEIKPNENFDHLLLHADVVEAVVQDRAGLQM